MKPTPNRCRAALEYAAGSSYDALRGQDMEFVIGTKTKPAAADNLLQRVRELDLGEGTLYIGYPVLTTHQEPLSLDAVLTTERHGIVAFELLDQPPKLDDTEAWDRIAEGQERIYLGLQSKLILYPELVHRRQLAVPLHIVTYAPWPFDVPETVENVVAAHPHSLGAVLDGLAQPIGERFKALNAAIQRVTTIKPKKKRQNVSKPSSRGAIIREVEKEIANLDRWQKQGAIESPEGPQRIRGLAGSGKTVVLALKAAYLHAQHPEWRIALTFQTRSLYQQLIDLVRRFSFGGSPVGC